MQDTKVNILHSFGALGIQVSKSLRKGELVEMLVSVFDEKPFYIINHLPEDEQKILSKLIACRQDEGNPSLLYRLPQTCRRTYYKVKCFEEFIRLYEEVTKISLYV